MKDLPFFARRLRQLRDDAKMTQHELAERSGIHQVSIARLEMGTRGPSWHVVMLLAHALGVPTSAFDDPDIIPPVVEVKRGRGRPRLDTGQGEPAAAKQKGRKRKG
jgi:transcriptional regulator with XRE-family HTH domain